MTKTEPQAREDPEMAAIKEICATASRSGLDPFALLSPLFSFVEGYDPDRARLEQKLCEWLLEHVNEYSFHFKPSYLQQRLRDIEIMMDLSKPQRPLPRKLYTLSTPSKGADFLGGISVSPKAAPVQRVTREELEREDLSWPPVFGERYLVEKGKNGKRN